MRYGIIFPSNAIGRKLTQPRCAASRGGSLRRAPAKRSTPLKPILSKRLGMGPGGEEGHVGEQM
jgi:hypothetical protein